MRTLRWIRDITLNRPLVWLNPDTNEVAEVEHIARFRGDLTWWTLRPTYFHRFLTVQAECGCRHRFGRWLTLVCWDHARTEAGS